MDYTGALINGLSSGLTSGGWGRWTAATSLHRVLIIIIRLLRTAITKATGYIKHRKIRIHKC